jgi:hypothetical protein
MLAVPPAGMLLPVPKFSKFLHGAALLMQERCANVPYWFLPGARGSGACWDGPESLT